MPEQSFTISFPELSRAEANRCAGDLATTLRELHGITVDQARDRNETQDFGATLAIIVGSAFATEIAKGIALWIKRTGTRINITTNTGTVVASDVDSSDLARIVAAIAHRE
jgi:hypothetical protein